MKRLRFSFWHWFLVGEQTKPGILRFWDGWLLVHSGIGLTMASIVTMDIRTIGGTVLLPLAGVLVGLSFAWAGNAQALLQSREMDRVAEHHEGGFKEFAFAYQAAILVILCTLVLWGIAGLGIVDEVWPTPTKANQYYAIKVIMFGISSIAVRECWHVVIGAQWMLLAQREVRRADREEPRGGREK